MYFTSPFAFLTCRMIVRSSVPAASVSCFTTSAVSVPFDPDTVAFALVTFPCASFVMVTDASAFLSPETVISTLDVSMVVSCFPSGFTSGFVSCFPFGFTSGFVSEVPGFTDEPPPLLPVFPVNSTVPYTFEPDQPIPVSSYQLNVPIRLPSFASLIWNSSPILVPFAGLISVHLKAASTTYPPSIVFVADLTFSARHFLPLKDCSFS